MVGVAAALIARRLLAPIAASPRASRRSPPATCRARWRRPATTRSPCWPASSTPWPPRWRPSSASCGAPSGWRRWGASRPRSPTRCATRSTPSGSTPSCSPRSWRPSPARRRRPAPCAPPSRARWTGSTPSPRSTCASPARRAPPPAATTLPSCSATSSTSWPPSWPPAASRCGASSARGAGHPRRRGPAARRPPQPGPKRPGGHAPAAARSRCRPGGPTATWSSRCATPATASRPEALPRLFDPFYSTKERGTGLGLAFVQEVVQEHGGTVPLRGRPGARRHLHRPPAGRQRRLR